MRSVTSAGLRFSNVRAERAGTHFPAIQFPWVGADEAIRCVPFACGSARRRRGCRPAAHVDASRESGSLADDDAGSLNVAFENAGREKLHALVGAHVADDAPRDGHSAGRDLGQNDAVRADPKRLRDFHAAFQATLHEDVFVSEELPLEPDLRADEGRAGLRIFTAWGRRTAALSEDRHRAAGSLTGRRRRRHRESPASRRQMDPLDIGHLFELVGRTVQPAVADPADRQRDVAVERPFVDHDPPGREIPADGRRRRRLSEDARAEPVPAVVGQSDYLLEGVEDHEGTNGSKSLLGPEEGLLLLAPPQDLRLLELDQRRGEERGVGLAADEKTAAALQGLSDLIRRDVQALVLSDGADVRLLVARIAHLQPADSLDEALPKVHGDRALHEEPLCGDAELPAVRATSEEARGGRLRQVRALEDDERVVPRELGDVLPVSYTHLRAHETVLDLVC